MRKRPLVASAVLIASFTGCATQVPPRCSFVDFAASPSDHIIEQMEHTEVRSFTGVLHSDDIGGPWPSELAAHFEIHGMNGFHAIVPVGERGVFSAELAPGYYCFKLSAAEFRSTLGSVRVNHVAANRELRIRMIIAE